MWIFIHPTTALIQIFCYSQMYRMVLRLFKAISSGQDSGTLTVTFISRLYSGTLSCQGPSGQFGA